MNEKHRFDSLITCRIVAVGEIDPDITFCGFETGLPRSGTISPHRWRRRARDEGKSSPQRLRRRWRRVPHPHKA